MIIRLKKTFDIVIDRMPDFARKLSVSARLNGKKSRVPFDKRFAVTGKHGFRGRPGGSEMMEKMLAVHGSIIFWTYILAKHGVYVSVSCFLFFCT